MLPNYHPNKFWVSKNPTLVVNLDSKSNKDNTSGYWYVDEISARGGLNKKGIYLQIGEKCNI